MSLFLTDKDSRLLKSCQVSIDYGVGLESEVVSELLDIVDRQSKTLQRCVEQRDKLQTTTEDRAMWPKSVLDLELKIIMDSNGQK